MSFSLRVVPPGSRWLVLLAAAALFACDAPDKRALRELSRRGIEASGSSLVEAVAAGDARRTRWLLEAGVHTELVDEAGRTPLRIALENGEISTVFRLIEAGADVNAVVPAGGGVLAAAIEADETAVAETLVARGARADGPTRSGEMVLPWAIRSGRVVAARAMLRAGADPHLTDQEGNPLLHLAIASGRRDLAENLLKLGADPGVVNPVGTGTLHLALDRGWLDFVPRLVAAGADPNLAVPGSGTPLQLAVYNGFVDQAEVLLAAGADPDLVIDERFGSPLEMVLAGGSPDLLDVFLRHPLRLDGTRAAAALRNMVDRGDLQGVRLLLAKGTPSGFRGPDGLLPMEAAVAAGRGNIVKLLLDFGQPAGAALHIASARGDLGMASLLIASGVHPNRTLPPSLDTPLAAALRGRHDRLAAYLVRRGADPRLRVPEGQAPLHLAIIKGCDETAEQLLEAGADPNAPFAQPVSPEFLKFVRPGIVRWALIKDRNVTPLMVAADAGNIPLARKLMAAGAKQSVWTRTARLWPINFASRRNDIPMMRLLLGRDPEREERHIVINLSQQRAWMYDRDGNEIFSTRVSAGKKSKPTPTGEFVITNKHRHWTSTIYDASMPYFQRLSCSDFGLHQGHVPGYPASSGCIRVPAGDAARLFSMTQAGDRVRIDP